MNELIGWTPSRVLTLALGLGIAAFSAQQTNATEARSTLSVSVQVIDPCQVTVATDGTWLSFGCPGASFDFSSFATPAVAATPTASVVEGLEFVDVTY